MGGLSADGKELWLSGRYDNEVYAIDATNGSLLWKASLGAQIVSGPITYETDGKQYVTAISGLSLCVFGLRD